MTLWFSLILVLLLAGAVLVVGAAYLMAMVLVRPPRMTDGKAAWVLKRLSPGDLGLHYQSVWFDVRDERTGGPLRLAAWWIPHPNALGRCAVLLHGYADAKVGAIAVAPTLHSLGYNILALDLRGHGESEGKYVTVGYFERHDLNQVIDQLRAQRPQDTKRIVLYGLSLGGTVALAAGVMRDDLCAMVLDSLAADEEHAAMIQFDLLGMPGRMVQKLAIRMAHWLTGADFAAVCPLEAIPRVRCPMMLIQPVNDVYVPPEDMRAIEAAAAKRPGECPTALWRMDDCTHLMVLRADPQLYRQRVGEFLERYCESCSVAQD